VKRFNRLQLAGAFICYWLWMAIYPRRYAYNNRMADWLLSWAGVWGYRDLNDV
jgi:hypothetical protein